MAAMPRIHELGRGGEVGEDRSRKNSNDDERARTQNLQSPLLPLPLTQLSTQ